MTEIKATNDANELNSLTSNSEQVIEFDDSDFARPMKRIMKIIIQRGRVVDGIQFVYDKDKIARHHGGEGGQCVEFNLDDGEYIVEVRGATGIDPFADESRSLSELHIRTNKGRSVSAGMGASFAREIKPFSYKASHGKQIIALKGTLYQSKKDCFISSIEIGLEKDIPGLIFDDSEFSKDKQRVSAINIHAGRVVDSIQFIYDGKYSAPLRGGSGGSPMRFNLDDDEYITEMSGLVGKDPFARADKTLAQLTLKTNKGRHISAGMGTGFSEETEPFSYSASQGKQIFALKGAFYADGKDLFIKSLAIGSEKGV